MINWFTHVSNIIEKVIFIRYFISVCQFYHIKTIDSINNNDSVDHLVLVKPIISPNSLKHFLQRIKSYFLIRPIWHLQFLHSLLSFPYVLKWVLQSRLGIIFMVKINNFYKLNQISILLTTILFQYQTKFENVCLDFIQWCHYF